MVSDNNFERFFFFFFFCLALQLFKCFYWKTRQCWLRKWVGFDVISPFHEYMKCLNETISVLCSSYHFHLHCDTSLISVDPLWPVFLRYLQISISGRNCAVLIQIYFTTLNTALNKKKNKLYSFIKEQMTEDKKWQFFLLFANYAFWLGLQYVTCPFAMEKEAKRRR